MNQKACEKFKNRAKVIKALAHPTRLFIVEELAKEGRCVNDLTGMVCVDVSTVSKHLAVLREAGIVDFEKKGLQVCYRLRMNCAPDLLKCIDSMIAKNCAAKRK